MAILHIQLDIDSDVLPELHAVLSAISKNLSRAERLRQLASAGLIWEHLRVHTNATASGVAKSLVGVPLAEAEAALDLPAAAEPAPARPGALPRAVFSTPAPAPDDIALDLALDLDAAVSTPPLEAAPAPARQPAAPRFVPVLNDVVEGVTPPKAAARRDGAAPRARSTAAREPVVEPAAEPVARVPLQPDDFPGEPAAAVAPPEEAAPPARKSGARSRLIRMQEKGLFKNG